MSILDVSDIVASPPGGTQVVSVTRVAVGSHVDGLWVDGADTAQDIDVSVQPLTDRDRRVLPEGLRTKELQKVYTTFALRTADEKAGHNADVILYQGDNHKVVAITNRAANGYTRAFMERLK